MEKKITELVFAEYNPRTINKHDFESLKNSIKEFGFVEPVVINKDNTVIGGHQRLRAAEELGIESVPVVQIDISKDKEKLLNMALNRISGEFDTLKLSELCNGLFSENSDLKLSGFTDKEMENILHNEFEMEEFTDDDRLDEKKKTKCPECGYEFTN